MLRFSSLPLMTLSRQQEQGAHGPLPMSPKSLPPLDSMPSGTVCRDEDVRLTPYLDG